ncbi:14779_t:CDS:2, partial [Racocetra persica]
IQDDDIEIIGTTAEAPQVFNKFVTNIIGDETNSNLIREESQIILANDIWNIDITEEFQESNSQVLHADDESYNSWDINEDINESDNDSWNTDKID